MMHRIDAILSRIFFVAVAILGLGLVALIGIEVFFRYFVGHALSWPEEVAGILFTWFTLVGIVMVTRTGEHIEFDFLTRRVPALVYKIIMVFNQVLIAVFAVFMIFYGYSYAMMFTFEKTPASGINLLWLHFSLPISGVLILFYAQWSILKILRPPKNSGGTP